LQKIDVWSTHWSPHILYYVRRICNRTICYHDMLANC